MCPFSLGLIVPISNARVARGLSYPSLVVFRLRLVFFFGGNDLDSVPVRVVTGLVTLTGPNESESRV